MKFNKNSYSKNLPVITLFFLFFTFSFCDGYIPKDEDERETIERFRGKKITLGLNNRSFYEKRSKYNNKSINDVFIELFNGYLGLDVSVKRDSFSTLLNKSEDDEVDIISFITEHEKRRGSLLFSSSVYSDAVYVVSSGKKIYSMEDLQGEKIYVASRDIYRKFLERVLFNSNIQSEIIEVDNLDRYKDELILTGNPLIFNPVSGVKISNSSKSAIGIRNELKDLLPIINNALESRYRDLLNHQISLIKKEIALENFYSSLTEEEASYLKDLKYININYNKELESDLYYRSKLDGDIKGIVPDIVEIIGRTLGVKVNELNYGYSEEGTKEESVDVYILSKTMERSKYLTFTDTIYNIPVYSVMLKNTDHDNCIVGAVKGSVESEIVETYYIYDNVKIYSTYDSLVDALNSGEVTEVLSKNTNLLSEKTYDISLFEKMPVSLAFKIEDELLRSIVDKGISKLILLEGVINNSIIEKSNEDLYILSEKNYKKRNVRIYSIGLILLLLVSFIKIMSDRRYRLKLLKDPLSQLPNRVVFNEFCTNKSKSSEGYAVIIDFDNFKEINDNYGHEVGDKIIAEFSEYLRKNFDAKFIFRISGDEFYGVIDRGLQEIVDIFGNYDSFCSLMKKHGISFSMGIYRKLLDSCIKDDFKYADMAMFEAKKISGFSYKIADEEFITGKKREEQILEILNGEVREVYPVFQPKVDLDTNEVVGAEALARCSSDTLGMIYPLEFIGLAEKYNIIHKIDYKIARESIRFIRERLDNNEIKGEFRLSINISVKTFKRSDLVEVISEYLEEYQVSGEYIEIEITESVLMSDMKDIIYKLNKLIELGIQISLDDFTAGHSAAGLLPILPLSIVKFDKSLLDLFNKSEKKGKIVYLNLISLIKDLNLKIVAEGIESIKELEFLKDSGVDYGQGYLLGRPETYKDRKILEIGTV